MVFRSKAQEYNELRKGKFVSPLWGDLDLETPLSPTRDRSQDSGQCSPNLHPGDIMPLFSPI